MTHSELVRLAERWLFNTKNCGVVITDMTSSAPETPDAIGWREAQSILVECKTSRADFLADKAKLFRRYPEQGMGSARYFLAPKGIIAPDDLPDGWGLLTADSDGVSEAYPASRKEPCRANELRLMLSALRRMVVVEKVRGVRCRVYRFEGDGDARATVAVADSATTVFAPPAPPQGTI